MSNHEASKLGDIHNKAATSSEAMEDVSMEVCEYIRCLLDMLGEDANCEEREILMNYATKCNDESNESYDTPDVGEQYEWYTDERDDTVSNELSLGRGDKKRLELFRVLRDVSEQWVEEQSLLLANLEGDGISPKAIGEVVALWTELEAFGACYEASYSDGSQGAIRHD